jgi:hypothetical protein
VKDLLYLSFNIGAKRRSAKSANPIGNRPRLTSTSQRVILINGAAIL